MAKAYDVNQSTVQRLYRLTISGIVSYCEEDSEIRDLLMDSERLPADKLRDVKEVALQELEEQVGLDTIKVKLEEV